MLNTPIDLRKSVAELVIEQPGLIRLFEKLGIDYCCGGKRSLDEACTKKGLDPETVVKTLNAFLEAQEHGASESTDWTQVGLAEFCDRIEQTHHRFLKEALPRLQALVHKVSTVHGDQEPHLHRVKDVFNHMSQELLSHMQKEEQILFPLIRKLEATDAAPVGMSVAAPIQRMEEEHESSGDDLETLSQLTNGYVPPPHACGSYRAMLAGLQEIELDLHQHIHKENNILFPRAIEKEQRRSS